MSARPLTMALHPGGLAGFVTGCLGLLPELTRAPSISLGAGLAPTVTARLGVLAAWALARGMRRGSPQVWLTIPCPFLAFYRQIPDWRANDPPSILLLGSTALGLRSPSNAATTD
ncbi:hypothetical protein B0H13DRAFT_1993185, partial [Mycena leptocephala]